MQQLRRPRSEGSPTHPEETCTSFLRLRFHCPGATNAPCSDVAATNPQHTTQLWKTVRSHLDRTANPKGKRTGTPSAIESVTSALESSSIKNGKEIAAKVTDVDFTELVLEPYGIEIQQKGFKRDLRKFFNILDLPSESQDRLNIYKKSFALDVWLEPDAKRISREYKAMQVYGCNEAEYSASALRDIFLDGPRHPWLPLEGEKCWLPVRMLQLVRKPPQDEWHAPPLIYPLRKRYEWDTRPDCAYHVSLQAFDASFRTNVQQHVSVVQKRALCPYLTVEFKKDEDSLATARHQAAVASAIALYNRYRLKRVALEMSNNEWSEEHRNQMRHYVITFAGSSWNLWCTVPKTFPDWTGCDMSTIYSGDCCILADVQKLVSIINDLHYWGLQIHGKSCKADIYAKIRSDPDVDLNDVSILEDHSE